MHPLHKPRLLAALFLSSAALHPVPAADEVFIEVIPAHQLGEAHNFWSVSNFTSQDGFADPQWVDGLARQHPFMREVNCVRLMGGRSDGLNEFYRGTGADGRVICDFSPLLQYIRGILDGGYTPRLVLDNVPSAMSSAGVLHTYGNTYPPDDYTVYHAYVRSLVLALVEAFGTDAVSRWRFRVGTEPDLNPGHWVGTREDYLRLYDYAVDAVTSVIPGADIGPGNILNPLSYQGPAKPVWGLDIIDHAAAGTNFRTGLTGTRMTCFSISWYDDVGLLGDVHSLGAAVAAVRRRLDLYPQFHDIPVEVAEFMILKDEAGARLWSGDITEWSASWFAAVAEQVYREGIAQVHLWSTTSEGVPHPQARVIQFLEQAAGGQLLETVVRTRPRARGKVGALAIGRDGVLYLLLYHHDRQRTVDESFEWRIRVSQPPGNPAATWQADHWQIDATHGVFAHQLLEDCLAAGIEPLEESGQYDGSLHRWFGQAGVEHFKRNREVYQRLSENYILETAQPVTQADDHVLLDVTLPGHSVRMIRIYPAGPEAASGVVEDHSPGGPRLKAPGRSSRRKVR